MIKTLSLLYILFFCTAVQAQVRGAGEDVPAGTTNNNYALVVGISSYQNIGRLNYADDDAHSFADFLVAHRICDKKNVEKLIDSAATTANFYKELKKMLAKAKENDRVFIYFAGHGDVENEIESGFLLTYNTEATNYSAGAIDIAMLEKYLNAFTNKKAKVVLITDACRSGNLAGGLAGASNTLSSLSKGFQNVIKILSCQPNQLSEEKAYPGGGHGVFTYHLVNGLNGLADKEGEGFITLRELDRYLDEVGKETGDKQIPKVEGNPAEKLVVYDNEIRVATLAKQKINTAPAVASSNKKRNGTDSTWITNAYFRSFTDKVRKLQLLKPDTANAFAVLQGAIKSKQPPALIEEMKLELAAVMEDEAQKWINKYLRGELEFDTSLVVRELRQAQAYLGTVESLIGKSDIRYTDIHVKKLFFEGYELFVHENKGEYSAAINKLEEANTLVPGQAWILHGLALLYSGAGQHDKSIEREKEAIKFAPKWKYPWSSLSLSYIDIGSYDEAIGAITKALEIDSLYSFAINNMGVAMENKGDVEGAERWYLRSVTLNPTYHHPLRNLGTLYASKKDYEVAEQYLVKAVTVAPLFKDGWYSLGDFYFDRGKYDAAQQGFYTALRIDPLDDDSWNGLGRIKHEQKDYDSAVCFYRQAFRINPAEVVFASNLGLVMQQKDMPDSAAHYYWIALRNTKEDLNEATVNLERLYKNHFDRVDYQELVRLYSYVVQKEPSARLYIRLAESYIMLRDYTHAAESYHHAYNLKKDKNLLHAEVVMRVKANPTLNDREVLASLLSIHPESVEALVEYGYFQNANMPAYNQSVIDSLSASGQGVRISPYLKYYIGFEVLNGNSWFELAEQYKIHKLSTDSIRAFLQQAIRIDSTTAEYSVWPALSALEGKEFTAKAIRYLEKESKGSKSYMLLYNLARCYHLVGDSANTVKLLKEATSNYDVPRLRQSDFPGISDAGWMKIIE